jgi:glucokinase
MPKTEKYAVGVDLGGTNIKIGIVTQKGKIIKKISLSSKAEGGPEKVIKQIKLGVKEILSGNKNKIRGIGIGSPGVVSVKKGTVENPPNFPGWTKVNLGSIIRKELDIDCHVENDANAAAIGEMIFGSGKRYNSFVMITLGTGVGGGIIINRKLYRGEIGAAGEVGHITINYNGPRCNCGSYGCIEAYVGNNYLISRVKSDLTSLPNPRILKLVKNDLNLLTPIIINKAAENGDAFAKSVINEMGEQIGSALASVSNLMDVSTFIIGGGVSGFGKPLFNAINKSLVERVITSLRNRVKVLPAKLKNEAGIKGASALVFYKSQ